MVWGVAAVLLLQLVVLFANSSSRWVYGVGLRTFSLRGFGFESLWQHGFLSVVSVVCCQVEVCVMS